MHYDEKSDALYLRLDGVLTATMEYAPSADIKHLGFKLVWLGCSVRRERIFSLLGDHNPRLRPNLAIGRPCEIVTYIAP